MTTSSKADARMMNFLASPPERDVWSIASTTPEDLTYYAETGQLDFKFGKMVASGVAPIPPFSQPQSLSQKWGQEYARIGERRLLQLEPLDWQPKTCLLDGHSGFGYTESLNSGE